MSVLVQVKSGQVKVTATHDEPATEKQKEERLVKLFVSVFVSCLF